MNSVLRTVQGCGDYERLAQGVYENFLNMKLRDSTMKSVSNLMIIMKINVIHLFWLYIFFAESIIINIHC